MFLAGFFYIILFQAWVWKGAVGKHGQGFLIGGGIWREGNPCPYVGRSLSPERSLNS